MSTAPDDWRRMGQEDFLCGLTLTWKRYQAYGGNWEHEHCAFCQKKFLDPNYAEWMREALATASDAPTDSGYTNLRSGTTPSGEHWICRECFDDFLPEFGWQVVHSDPDSWPYDPPEPHPRPTAADYAGPGHGL